MADGESTQEWKLSFHGITYMINLVSTQYMMYLDLEDVESNERWSSEFTSQYVEEMTQKAGNYKKFSVFVKMLSSGFAKESESVFVDVLTSSDVDTLKARKAVGSSSNSSNGGSSSSNASSNRSSQKRYVIMTYAGEFDRVHYPLPLVFETEPNVEALQKTVKRLRKALQDRMTEDTLHDADGVGSKDKDAKYIIGHLRQENTELRHLLRQAKAPSAQGGGAAAANSPLVSELTATSSKQRKQIDALRKDLAETSAAYDKLLRDSTKEVAKWKLRAGAAAKDRLEFYVSGRDGDKKSDKKSGSNGAGDTGIEVRELRRRVMELERELRERDRHALSSSSLPPRQRSSTPPPRFLPDKARLTGAARSSLGTSGTSSGGWSPGGRRTGGRSSSAETARTSSTSRGRPVAPKDTKEARLRAAAAASHERERERGGRRPLERSRSPGPGVSGSAAAATGAGTSSSLGRRFDPTAYQRERAERAASAERNRPWSAGSRQGADRYNYANRESGYSSANSQESTGSRRSSSRRSAGRSQSQGSRTPQSEGQRSNAGSASRSRQQRQSKPSSRSSEEDGQQNGRPRSDNRTFGSASSSRPAAASSSKISMGAAGIAELQSSVDGFDFEDDTDLDAADNQDFSKGQERGKKLVSSRGAGGEIEDLSLSDTNAEGSSSPKKPFPIIAEPDHAANINVPANPFDAFIAVDEEEQRQQREIFEIAKAASPAKSSFPVSVPLDDELPGRRSGVAPLVTSTSILKNAAHSPTRPRKSAVTASYSPNSFVAAVTSHVRRSKERTGGVRTSSGSISRGSPRSSPRASFERETVTATVMGSSPLRRSGDDITEIDRRIQALQNYLDDVRVGILAADKP